MQPPPPLPDRLPSRPPSRRPPTSKHSLEAALASVSLNATPPSNPSQPAPPAPVDHSPLPWNHHFDQFQDVNLPSRDGTWRVYTAAMPKHPSLVLVFLHGGGHAALSWSLVTHRLKARLPIMAFDARGHGNTHTTSDTDLSANTQLLDTAELISHLFAPHKPNIVLCGHSMGGAIAARVAAERLIQNLVGLVVVDVVEGTALSALPYMSTWLQNRPSSFTTIEKAIRYVIKAGHVRNIQSARISVPPQLVQDPASARWVWRTQLGKSQQYWQGWFQGLSPLFLSVPAAKLLLLANVDRLDKDLMIAQMQGKFQNILIPSAGHTVHEDQPDQTATVIIDYLERNMFLSRSTEDEQSAIFQQRNPIPPCC